MPRPRSGPANAENVDPMVCIRPRDGSPRAALMSQLLIAYGLPPDSRCIRLRTTPSHDAGCPSIARACRTTLDHCDTPRPYVVAPVGTANRELRSCATVCPPTLLTKSHAGPAPDCNPLRNPPMIALPAGMRSCASMFSGPLCALIQSAIPEIHPVTDRHAD